MVAAPKRIEGRVAGHERDIFDGALRRPACSQMDRDARLGKPPARG